MVEPSLDNTFGRVCLAKVHLHLFILSLCFVHFCCSQSTENGFTDFTQPTSFPPASIIRSNVKINKIRNKACSCGVKGSQDVKIVGGVLSKEHSWPWVAAIVYVKDSKGPKVVCGSSVVSRKYLLTAAHCVEYIEQEGIKNFRAILGTNDINDKDALRLKLTAAYSHPKFNKRTLEYDVGIVELESEVEYSRAIIPICLTPQKGVPYVKRSAIVAGEF